MGAFTLAYLGQTDQISSRTLASSTLATTWSYLTNTNDRRLSGIGNVGLSSGQFSNYTFTTTPENFVSASTESNDTSTVYPPTGSQTATYNNLNQLTNLSGQALTFDSVGNVTSDGQRNYTWDAENRLIGITYPGATGKATAFTYDGLGRRVTISSTPAGGGSATVTSYLWCGDSICQARNASNVTTRSYYDEGEFVLGTPGQPYYYGTDQLGSVRRAFASTSSAPAYSYDPYGVPLQATAPVTDFVYAGMFYNADSGLYLTNYRAFDPNAGRWLLRDPLGEPTDPAANLYSYAAGNPVSLADPNGQNPLVIVGGAGALAGGGAKLFQELNRTNGNLSCVNWGAVGQAATIGAVTGLGGYGLLAGISARVAAALAARAAIAAAAGEYGMTTTVMKNLASRPFLDSPLLIKEIIAGGVSRPDPGGVPGALRFDVAGTMNRSIGRYELVIDPINNFIYHFNFVGGGR